MRNVTQTVGTQYAAIMGLLLLLLSGLPAYADPFVPNDPYFFTDNPAGFLGQWHLDKQTSGASIDINVAGAWARGLTGEGVVIGFVEAGIEHTHPDLAANYDASNSWDFYDGDPDPSPTQSADGAETHGTAVVGLAVARGGNGIGIAGVAPRASFGALRTWGPPYGGFAYADVEAMQKAIDAMRHHAVAPNPTIDIMNHSYGELSGYAAHYYPKVIELEEALVESVEAGVIHVVIAHNQRLMHGTDFRDADANRKMLCHLPEALTVTAVDGSSSFARYANFGACITATVPSGETIWKGGLNLITTDRAGDSGYCPTWDSFPDSAYMSIFTGTSSAAPIMSGVLALAKEAQPNLDTRFAKHLLARTCRMTDPDDSTPMGGWTVNGAGYHFNNNYGFGVVDADALTQMATEYQGVTPLETQTTGWVSAGGVRIPENDPNGVARTFSLEPGGPLEEVVVELHLAHWAGNYDGLEAVLISPEGTRSLLMYRHPYQGIHRDAPGYFSKMQNLYWTLTTHAFWGEDPEGTWTLAVSDVWTEGYWDGVYEIPWQHFKVTARSGTLVEIPEPATLGMLALGGLALIRRRKRGMCK